MSLSPVSNYLSKKNIMFSQQSCVIQVNDSIKKIVHSIPDDLKGLKKLEKRSTF